MLQRALATLLCLLGVAAIGLGVASATVWRPSDTLAASAEAAPGTTLLMTEPGVLSMAADEVAIRATAEPGTTIVLAIAPTADVEAWIGSDPVTRVTGLVDLDTLSTQDVAAAAPTAAPAATTEPTPAPTPTATAETGAPAATPDEPVTAPDPSGSDLWIHEVTGTGEVEADWTREDGRWSLLVATTGEDASPPSLTLTWPQVVTTPWLVPGVAVGAGLLLLGLIWWAVIALRARRNARRRRADENRERAITGAATAAAAVPATAASSTAGPSPSASSPSASSPSASNPSASNPSASNPVSSTPAAPTSAAATTTGPTPAVPLTRRQIRELEQGRVRAAFPQQISGPGTDPAAPVGPAVPPRTAPPGATPPRTDPPRTTPPRTDPPGATPPRTAADQAPSAAEMPPAGRPDQGERDDRPGRGAWMGRLHRPGRRGETAPPPEEPPAAASDAVEVEPPAPTTSPSGDAWRRAWGFPSQAEPSPEPTQDTTTDGGER